MKIKIICVGKIKEQFYRDDLAEYSKRISKFATVEICEAADEKTSENASAAERDLVLKKEGDRLVKFIGDKDHVTVLDIGGKKFDSVEFSEKLSDIMNSGRNTVDFIIGGSLGLDAEIKKRADMRLSFSDMTFPHQLMRVILLEQIYRAFKIINNEPYHK